MAGRTVAQDLYRFGFNGKENDNETYGTGNALDFGARIYDSRLGRFLSKDPHESSYAWQSTYCYAADSPILFIDTYGKGPEPVSTSWGTLYLAAGTTLIKTKASTELITINNLLEGTGVRWGSSFFSKLRFGATFMLVLLDVEAFEPARCCTNSMCGYGEPCEETMRNNPLLYPLRIFENNEDLPDWYLKEVYDRVKNGSTDPTDLAQVKEYHKRRMDNARKLGQEGEDLAGIISGITKVTIISITGKAKFRVPDELTDKVLKEVKNVSKQGLSPQMIDYILYVKEYGLKIELTVRENTRISKKLQKFIDDGTISIKKELPKK